MLPRLPWLPVLQRDTSRLSWLDTVWGSSGACGWEGAVWEVTISWFTSSSPEALEAPCKEPETDVWLAEDEALIAGFALLLFGLPAVQSRFASWRIPEVSALDFLGSSSWTGIKTSSLKRPPCALQALRIALRTTDSSKWEGIPESTSKRLWAVEPTKAWQASATASSVTPRPCGSLLARCRKIKSNVNPRWNHNISSGFPPAMFSKALSHSDGLAPLPGPCFPETEAVDATVTTVRSRFSFTFLRFESKLGLWGVWPGEDDDDDEESLQLVALVDEGTPTTDVPAPALSGRVTSATVRHTSIRAWK